MFYGSLCIVYYYLADIPSSHHPLPKAEPAFIAGPIPDGFLHTFHSVEGMWGDVG